MTERRKYTDVVASFETHIATVETHIVYMTNHLQNIDSHLQRLNDSVAENTHWRIKTTAILTLLGKISGCLFGGGVVIFVILKLTGFL